MWSCPTDNLGCTTYSANNAIDGDINTCMRTDYFGPPSPKQTVWWRVDLGDVKSIYSIRIQFKDYGQQYIKRQRGRMAGFSLYISNTTEIQGGYLCYKDGPELPLLDITNICINHGRYIIFYNERINGESYPDSYENIVITELCEVIVMGCHKGGFYGQSCDLICPHHCQERRCNIIKGTCLGCTAGWIGDFCNEACAFGYHGMECKTKCTGHCLGDASCNHISGLCEHWCEAGWFTPTCDQPCHDGWYGPNCTSKCSSNCRNSLLCDKASGKCESCVPGYIGTFCNNSCSKGNFGQNCSEICNIKCRGQNCFHENGFCTEGCEDGYQGKTCTEECNEGTYGGNCSKECSSKCIDTSCHNVHGECSYGCKPGWTGSHCSQSCRFGLYGENCTETCSSFCRTSLYCTNTDGNCIDGCMDGYIGPKCDKSCEGGWYGKNCSQRCNENCVNMTCDHGDGLCTFGYKPGWRTANCSEACVLGWYGQNCSNTCNHNCRNKSCDNVHGVCTYGCEAGWTRLNCSETSLKMAADNVAESDFQYYYVIALSVGFAVSLVINISTCFVVLRRKYWKNRGEGSRYVECSDVMAVKTETTHIYQELNAINSNDITYHNLSFGNSHSE
ncbi:multiple epidermal growth factor-like domains protein 10 [Saccostrea echinata]|uniref:multiple epidermal growth factor-like domains protein 10 n=1 Tax=Saccostrea echinata TaxID=191078 RepID=UPI002A817742|nr:multiple epidermal growth factor-like domains protein 10 [Saccostrea echinata]